MRSNMIDEKNLTENLEESEKNVCENKEEFQYLNHVRKIINEGHSVKDRTGVGTLSIFGAQMRWSLRDGVFPLLTTKRVFWKGVVEELLWFIRGSTDATELQKKGVMIWNENSSRKFLDSLGFTDRDEETLLVSNELFRIDSFTVPWLVRRCVVKNYDHFLLRTGDLGPIYGFQWRHFGAKYVNMFEDYSGKGVDQLQKVIDLIRDNPEDRRIIMSAWNPVDIPLMALPPCHCLVQFRVINGELYSQMYQRSADMGLGVPFNIASYSLLTCMIAHITNLKPGEFIHSMGDSHVYLNHINSLKTQLERKPRPFPKLTITRQVTEINDFTFEDFKLEGYNPHPKIPMEMAV